MCYDPTLQTGSWREYKREHLTAAAWKDTPGTRVGYGHYAA